MPEKSLENKKIAMIVAFQDFRDEEYFIPKSIFLGEGLKVETASIKKGEAVGSYGGVIDIALTLDDLNVSDLDAVVFVGGSGAAKYIENDRCHQIAKEVMAQNKVLGAICIAPAILARSGVLEDKNATVWSSNLDKSVVKILKGEGVNYENRPVVVDGKIITASGPQAARKFAEAIVRILTP